MQSAMEILNEEIKTNPDIIETLLDGKFNWDSFINGAGKLGFDIELADIEHYFAEEHPALSTDTGATYFVKDEQAGEFRELSTSELDAVSGGTTVVGAVVALIVYVAAIVATAAVVASAVMAAQTVAIGAWAVVAVGIVVAGTGSTGGGGGGYGTGGGSAGGGYITPRRPIAN
jgi:hypothetical protein